MKRGLFMRLSVSIAILALVAFQPSSGQEPLSLVRSIELPRVEGRIDHLAFDAAGQRLFVAALGNNTLEILDLKAGIHLHTITGLHEPQGVAFIPESNTIFVTNGKTGMCDMFDRMFPPQAMAQVR